MLMTFGQKLDKTAKSAFQIASAAVGALVGEPINLTAEAAGYNYDFAKTNLQGLGKKK